MKWRISLTLILSLVLLNVAHSFVYAEEVRPRYRESLSVEILTDGRFAEYKSQDFHIWHWLTGENANEGVNGVVTISLKNLSSEPATAIVYAPINSGYDLGTSYVHYPVSAPAWVIDSWIKVGYQTRPIQPGETIYLEYQIPTLISERVFSNVWILWNETYWLHSTVSNVEVGLIGP